MGLKGQAVHHSNAMAKVPSSPGSNFDSEEPGSPESANQSFYDDSLLGQLDKSAANSSACTLTPEPDTSNTFNISSPLPAATSLLTAAAMVSQQKNKLAKITVVKKEATSLSTTFSELSNELPLTPSASRTSGSPVSLSELDDLTDLFVAERNWQQELGSFNLTPISELDNMDTASSSSGSHFDFPDYASPEVSDILGGDLAWFNLCGTDMN
jgi:hypothetical protein